MSINCAQHPLKSSCETLHLDASKKYIITGVSRGEHKYQSSTYQERLKKLGLLN